MTKRIILLAVVLNMGACAHYQPTARAGLICQDEQCTRIWQRAQAWLATHSPYRIQIANDSIIQTYGPLENMPNTVAYTVTRELRADGKTMISIYGTCHSSGFGCLFDPSKATNQLYYALEGIK